MIFPKRQDFTPTQSSLALGQTIRFEVTREFHVECIMLVVGVTVSGVMATDNADSIQNIVNRVQVQVSDGARTRNVVDCSGAGLLELATQWQGGLDRNTASFIGTDAASAKVLVYPIWFAHPQLADPVGSALLLPVPRFNSNPIVSVTFSTQAQMDTHATPTFAVSALSAYCIIIRRQVNRPNFPTFDTELAELETSYPTTGNAQLYEIQIPGSYTGLLFRDYTSATARGSIQTAAGENRLQLLGTVLRRFRMEDLQYENDYSVNLYPATWNNFAGSYYLDFLTDKVGEVAGDLGSVLDSNILVASGSRVQLLQDITGGANVKRKIVSHRIFGNLKDLKF
jgi:hypothetical protein